MESNEISNNWNINIKDERVFWIKFTIENFIIINTICPYCNHGAVGTKKCDSLYNPIQGKCNYYKCSRNLYLRKGTIFEINS